ncbi:MAG: hypothetical protein Hyperionvirus5_109 [Hyperionvirus sp.]|uniref:Uncharacterized protein n=1 Tax=Hyperionvirus sp. TaxID=2487770 RepID=A0A3G5ABQ2_9VIRU|nr:MAG: hypothetical protein Hyperionvirus5_109 [Hyperionvirus sp.]
MEDLSLFKALPTDIQYLVTNYDPTILFRVLSYCELIKCDWFKLIKINFNLSYRREKWMNEEVMRAYFDNCCGKKSNIAFGENYTIIRSLDRILVRSEPSVSGNVFREVKGIKKNIAEMISGGRHTIIRLTDGTLMGYGCNRSGQLGLGEIQSAKEFVKIEVGDKKVAEVKCGCRYTIIRLVDGTF